MNNIKFIFCPTDFLENPISLDHKRFPFRLIPPKRLAKMSLQRSVKERSLRRMMQGTLVIMPTALIGKWFIRQ